MRSVQFCTGFISGIFPIKKAKKNHPMHIKKNILSKISELRREVLIRMTHGHVLRVLMTD